MAVMAIFTVKGDTKELLAKYDKSVQSVVDGASGRPLSHVCVPRDDGFMVVDVWESKDALEGFAQNPRFRQVLRDVGLPEPQVEVYPVHRLGWPD
jgi:quinol monooxygenase YgiN